jgi:hypothetical protein
MLAQLVDFDTSTTKSIASKGRNSSTARQAHSEGPVLGFGADADCQGLAFPGIEFEAARPALRKQPSRTTHRQHPGLKDAPSPAYVSDFLATSDGLALIKAFMRIKDPTVRRYIVLLVKQIAGTRD